MSIKAFDKEVDREKAYQIIINDYIGSIVHAHCTEVLEDILMGGWRSLEEWSDKELEDFIADLLIANQQ